MLTAESVTQGKPNPEIYQKAAATFGLSTREIAVLEDSADGEAAVTRAPGPGGHRRTQLTRDFTGAKSSPKALAINGSTPCLACP